MSDRKDLDALREKKIRADKIKKRITTNAQNRAVWRLAKEYKAKYKQYYQEEKAKLEEEARAADHE